MGENAAKSSRKTRHRPWLDPARISAERHEARLAALFKPSWGDKTVVREAEPEAEPAAEGERARRKRASERQPGRAWQGRDVLPRVRKQKSQKAEEA